jgi:uncharacterized RDD family membrane protein YckC
MKCPKCGYLGFETSDRCRNCGYDFSLAIEIAAPPELPLQSSEGGGAPLADFVIAERDVAADDPAATLDLNRVIGPTFAPGAASTSTAGASGVPKIAPGAPTAFVAPKPLRGGGGGDLALPFTESDDDTPLMTKPRPARPPLSVRRTTPEIPRTRLGPSTVRPDDAELAFPSETGEDEHDRTVTVASFRAPEVVGAATAGRRLLATLIDLLVLGSINAVVLYLTLALSGLTFTEVSVLPVMPIAAFFAILDGGYLVAFVAATGQTIGGMVAGIRVVGNDAQRVSVPAAVLRALGCGVSLLTAGLGYLPAFVTADRRALQDRISGTRVVSAR